DAPRLRAMPSGRSEGGFFAFSRYCTHSVPIFGHARPEWRERELGAFPAERRREEPAGRCTLVRSKPADDTSRAGLAFSLLWWAVSAFAPRKRRVSHDVLLIKSRITGGRGGRGRRRSPGGSSRPLLPGEVGRRRGGRTPPGLPPAASEATDAPRPAE